MTLRQPLAPARILIAAIAGAVLAVPGQAYLFWSTPQLKGQPVKGNEPGLTVPLPGATTKEIQANLLWSMRAGLNVAALQCQFAPALMTVANYNGLLRQHGAELATAYLTISGYFKRTGGKTWATKLDQFTTRTYNGYSTMHAQLGFCETAATIGRDALELPQGQLATLATRRMREFRNSLVPAGDMAFSFSPGTLSFGSQPSSATCTDRKGRPKACGS